MSISTNKITTEKKSTFHHEVYCKSSDLNNHAACLVYESVLNQIRKQNFANIFSKCLHSVLEYIIK